jgi:aminoglycoside/choline kinase family phosphotransferase
MVERYLNAFPELDAQDFWASYTLWGAQRCTKILGIFSRLSKRDHKPQYLAHLPRVKRILERDLSHPSLKALQQWFQGVGL